MNEHIPIYNSRLIKQTFDYICKHYPEINTDAILEYSGIARYELDDPGHWLSQRQSDLFYEALEEKTGNPDIIRASSRFIAESCEMGAVRQYMLGLITPKSIYLSAEKLNNTISQGTIIKTKSLGPNKVEVLAIPKSGINEKPYQCEYRNGTLESLAMPFTGKYAKVEHPECIHRGDKHCRHIVSWEMTPDLIWKKWRNLSILLGILISAGSYFTLPLLTWGYIPLLCTLITVILTGISYHYKEKLLTESIHNQGDAAKDLIYEINTRHNHSLLVQNIGLATSINQGINNIISTVIDVMELYLDFDRGFIMLTNDNETILNYIAGYGYTKEQENILTQTGISINVTESKDLLETCFNEQKPYLLNGINKDKSVIPFFGLKLSEPGDSQSLICVPIVYEHKCYGILAVTNTETKRTLTQTDLSLLMGMASQAALSIANAKSFNKLTKSEKKYRDLVENANSIIMRQTPDGNITFFNEFAQKYFGYEEDEVLGKNVAGVIFLETEISKKYINKLSASLQQNPEQQINRETKCRLKNGNAVWITWTNKPIFDHDGKLKEILCVGNDITALKSAEVEKRSLQFQLQQARKMEAIGTFAGGIAHDFNNILGSIVLNTELAYSETKDNEKSEYALKQVIKSSEYARDLIKRILSFARTSDLKPKPVHIAEIVMETTKLLKAMLPSTIMISEKIKCKDSIIMGDEAQIQQLIINLCKNSAQAMEMNGGGFLSISLSITNSGIKLSVSDSGPGISPDIADRIFDPFFTTKPVGMGTGLGLSMVQRIVQDHNGEIDVETRLDAGTTFHIYFPVTERKIKLVQEKNDALPLTGNESIFIIDDEKVLLDVYKRVLERQEYVITTCENSKEALQKFEDNPNVFDLVITDMTMPFMTGDKLAKELKRVRPDIPIILASGYSEHMNKKKANNLGIDMFLAKPINLTDLTIAIREVLDQNAKSSGLAAL